MTERPMTTSDLNTTPTSDLVLIVVHFSVDDEGEGKLGRIRPLQPGSQCTAIYYQNLVVIRFLLMMREKVTEGEDDHRPPICNQHQLQFNTNYNPKK